MGKLYTFLVITLVTSFLCHDAKGQTDPAKTQNLGMPVCFGL